MDHNHGAMQSTPWNVNLDYAVDWSVALGVPVVLLTVRHLFLSISRAIEDRRQGGQGHALLATVDSTEVETDELGVDIPTRSSKASATTTKWSYSRIETWITNKASATLYLGSVVHLVAGATLLALIFLSILAVLLTSDVNLKLNSNRAGYLGLACIPFLFAFTGKNSIITLMTGISHHRINQVHRFLGLSLFVLISVHMGCMMKSWWPWKALLAQQLATPKVRYGLATYATLCLLVVTAAWPVRRYAYEAFVVSHSLFLVFLVLVGLHTPYAMRFTAVGIFFYVINVLTGWCVKSKMALAQATVFQDRLTRLRMDRSVAHAPGQHIYVCVPSMSLIQWHPFTISSSDQTSLTVHARAVGGFTKKLCRWPENSQRRVLLAGPYGESVQVGRSLDIQKVVFVAAGSGLAYIVPILMDFLQARRQSKASCGHVEIAWCVRDPDEVQWFQEELEMALDAAQGYLDTIEKEKEETGLIAPDGPETQLCLTIHYTRLAFEDHGSLEMPAPLHQHQGSSTSTSGTATLATEVAKKALNNVPFAGDNRVEWMQSRLDVGQYVQRQIEEIEGDRAVDIVGCGPALMLAQLHNAVAANESLTGCRVNLHTERFYM
ncbi:ferric reductase like transmembrane component-domain-containing protein [Linnemannia elongata]|nr:ferric reductase like transmembrane component-domain-containing protein [Linnemannia elongata]